MPVECAFAKYTGPLRCFDQFVPDLGLAYLSAALKQEGYGCELINLDLPGNSPKDLLDYLERNRPPVLAVKLLRTGFPELIRLLEEAKKVSPKTLIVGGGAHAHVCRETVLEFTDAFDALIIGESDRAIVQVMEVARGERPLEEVENVLFRDRSGNLVRKPTSAVESIDDLPLPDWGLLDLERYFPIFPISARRGCPFACAFCNFNYVSSRENVQTGIDQNGTVHVLRKVPDRKRSVPSLSREILRSVEQYKVPLFAMTDPLPDARLTEELSDWLISSGLTTRWTSFARVGSMDKVFDKMARAGWVSMWFGIESGSPKVLRKMNKLYSIEDIKRSIDAAYQTGIKCIGAFIMGFPGEDEETITESFNLAGELPLYGVIYSPFALAPGSIAAEMPERYGIRPHDDWMKKYTYIPGGQSPFDIPYFDIDGEDNVARLQRFNPLVNNAYKKFIHRQLVDDTDYAELISSTMEGVPAEEILKKTATFLGTEDFKGWEEFLSQVWRAAERAALTRRDSLAK